jgi:glycosyl transferase, family 25
MKPLKTYVINLDQDKARLDFFTANFSQLGIPFERIAAVDGRQYSENDYRDFMRIRPRKNKIWLRGQMGCFLSHYKTWEKIAAGEDRFCAVFEDDVQPSSRLAKIIADDSWIPDDVDLIRLDTSTNRVRLTAQPTITHLTNKLYGVKSTSWCTGGYLLSKRAAEKLLALPSAAHQPSDVILYNFEVSAIAKNFHILQFQPALCTQTKHLAAGKENFSSNIESADNQPSAWQQTLKKMTPDAIIKAAYRTLFGYKRIGFE